MPDTLNIIIILAALSLIPILLILFTSFTKIVIVLSILRQALGTAQAPTNMIIMSLALLLTCFSMYPVWVEIDKNLDYKIINLASKDSLLHIVEVSKLPIKNFLFSNSSKEDRKLFMDILQKHNKKDITEEDFIIISPAFLIGQLALGFKIGFLLYLPFLVVDMTIANVLMALGMQMLSPTTISIPFKLMVFVLMDGWRLLAQNLIKN